MLSAVEGLKLVTPVLEPYVLPITVMILFALFWVQSRGTERVSAWFGPVTLVWFVTLAALGLLHAFDRPLIFRAIDPSMAVGFLIEHGLGSFAVMGSVFLAVTGAEALYADMGHFGRGPIRLAWSVVVFPALALNYLGQGSLVLAHPEAAENSFYLLAPAWGLPALVLLATVATVIASQAVITGAYSLTQQAVQLGLLPRFEIRHTSEEMRGQIYMPKVNGLLLVAVLGLTVLFGSSSALASAYGIAVTGTMMVTSLLAFPVLRRVWRWPLVAVVAILAPLLTIEAIFLGANLTKFFAGGYVPILMALALALAMVTWVRGLALVLKMIREGSTGLTSLIRSLEKSHPARVGGTAVFLASDPDVAPAALLHNLKHNRVLHESNIIVHVSVSEYPARAGRRASDHRIHQCRLHSHPHGLRLYGAAQHNPRTRARAQGGCQVRHHVDLVLPQPAKPEALRRARHAALAGQALHLAQQVGRQHDELLSPAREPGGRTWATNDHLAGCPRSRNLRIARAFVACKLLGTSAATVSSLGEYLFGASRRSRRSTSLSRFPDRL